MTRAEKVTEAQRLRAAGLTILEIAERMGICRSTAGNYLADPDLAKQRERRERYAGRCVDCGAPTDGSDGYGRGPVRCQPCAESQPHSVERARAALHRSQRTWTDDEILVALRSADREGIQSVKQWNDVADPDRPSAPTIVTRFGTWNRAREIAGLAICHPRRASYPHTTTEDCARAVAGVWEALGSVPSYNVYVGYRQIERPDLPSGALIRIRCGSWVTALEMAQALVREPVAA